MVVETSTELGTCCSRATDYLLWDITCMITWRQSRSNYDICGIKGKFTPYVSVRGVRFHLRNEHFEKFRIFISTNAFFVFPTSRARAINTKFDFMLVTKKVLPTGAQDYTFWVLTFGQAGVGIFCINPRFHPTDIA